ncbi:hypothetical protein [uncultured Rhodospira sp.]|uniref:hypothetical protein n=1 Tax=uncultured Rhodospira sp. TaxID=1936189 RepID=UPI0026122936|nr:hypothetical protein [uncultured Rhodospira sp.]
MSRTTATAFLGVFGLLACLLVAWGVTDILSWRGEMARCSARVDIDTSSCWFVGAVGVCALPLLAFTRSERAHAWIFSVFVALFLVLPGLAFMAVKQPAVEAGYTSEKTITYIPPGAFTLVPTAPECRPTARRSGPATDVDGRSQ